MTSLRALIGRSTGGRISGYRRLRNKAMRDARECLIGIETMDQDRAEAMRKLAALYEDSAKTYETLASIAAEQLI